MLAAVDLEAEGRATARAVLSAGYTLAMHPGSEPAALHVVHAWSLLGESILSCPLRGIPAARLRTLAVRVAGERRSSLERLCAETLPRPPASVYVQRGDPRSVIPTLARRLRADLVVLGRPSHAILGGLVLGGVPQAVLGRLPCDLLIVGGSPSTGSRTAATSSRLRR